MGRAQKNRRRGAKNTASVQAPAGDARPNPAVTEFTGRERHDFADTISPIIPDDPKARVIKIYARNAAPSA